ncbi:MAG: hypothetical protein GXP29_12515 [Planctomycetes bacterium]|nr:hypothetical protein [Planctomycetota bacterium]
MLRRDNGILCKRTLCKVAGLLLWAVVPTIAQTNANNDNTNANLGAYVPEDVWLYSRTWRTPERDIITEHWARIFDAILSCGIEQEVRSAIYTTLPADKKPEFDKTWTEITTAIRAVDWPDLFCNEFVIAERFTSVVPDVMIIARPKPKTLKQNVKGLADLFDLFNTYAVGNPVPPKRNKGVTVWSIESENGAVGLHLLHADDKIALVFGQAARRDVQSLFAGERNVTSILKNAKFQNAIKQAPKPGFAVTYLDIDRLFKWISKFPSFVFGEKDQTEGIMTVRRVIGTLTRHCDFLDYMVATQEVRNGRQIEHTIVKIKPDCCQKPLARALFQQKPIENFARFLPVESRTYVVSTMLDSRIIYDTVLEVVRTDIPDGSLYLQKWEDAQKSINLDVRKDLLDWLGGEFILSSFPAIRPTPFAKDDIVLLLRVRNVELARTKVPMLTKRGTDFIKSRGQQISVTPASNLPIEGFQNLTVPTMAMFIGTPCLGLWDDWLVLGTSEAAIDRVMKTASGDHPSITENKRIQNEALIPSGPVMAASFTDLSNVGQELSSAFFGAGFTAGMLPDKPEVAPVKAMLNSLVRLGPVMNQIDFLSSSSSVSTFKDNTWHSKTVTTYKPKPATKAK